MASPVRHATQTAASDNPAYDVSSGEWNADHTVDTGASGDLKPVGSATAGSTTKVADAGHIHPFSYVDSMFMLAKGLR